MIKNRFEYLAPQSVDEAVSLLGAETEVIGGGTWVVVEMTQGVRNPKRVVDLKRAGLDYVREENGALAIGAAATYTDVIRSDASKGFPALRKMAEGVTGGAQLRNRGTLGGSACYAIPSSDVPGCLVGLGATMRVRGQGGKREIPASEFFVGGFKTSLQPGELLEEISIPAAAGKQGYYKFKLCESSWPIATGTCVVGGDGGARITLGAVNARPVSVEVSGSDPDEAARAAEGAVTEPWTDTLADGEYRKMIAGVIAKRALAAAEGGVGQ